MSHSTSSVLIHVVWATFKRTAWIDPAVGRMLRDAMTAQGRRLRCLLHAAGASDDHMHVVTELDRNVPIATLVRALKGASAREAVRAFPSLHFRWQEGYGAFSVSERDPEAVISYVRNQRERHAARRIDERWEHWDA
jgi:putative transposase